MSGVPDPAIRDALSMLEPELLGYVVGTEMWSGPVLELQIAFASSTRSKSTGTTKPALPVCL